MKNFKFLNRLPLITMLVMICCFVISTSASADMVSNAGLIPAGYGYTHGRIPVIEATGRPEIHDAAIMRYDKNSRIRDVDNTSDQNENRNQNNSNQYRQEF